MISARVDESTYEIFQEKSKDFKNASECMRQLIVADEPKRNIKLQQILFDVRYELRKIGNNVNQIAKNNNSQFYSDADKRNLKKYLEQILLLEEKMIVKVNEKQI